MTAVDAAFPLAAETPIKIGSATLITENTDETVCAATEYMFIYSLTSTADAETQSTAEQFLLISPVSARDARDETASIANIVDIILLRLFIKILSLCIPYAVTA